MGVLPGTPPTLVLVSNLDDWRELATKELKGKDPDTLAWLRTRGSADVFRNVLKAPDERAIIASEQRPHDDSRAARVST